MREKGFYIISDDFFKDFPDPFLKGNKDENRPHYYAISDEKTDIYWVIPMSSRVEKYKKIITYRESKGKPCDILHIAKLDNGKKSVFLIQDIFPVSDKYILRKYTINGNHLRITSENLAKIIEKKAKKTLALIKKGVKFSNTQPDVISIEHKLLQEKEIFDAFIEGINKR